MMSDFYRKTLRSMLDRVVLEAINDKVCHGYALITYIRKKFGTYLGPSTIYPLLNDLEQKGFIISSWNLTNARPQKQYCVTSRGQAALKDMRVDISILVDSLQIESSI